jgi:hypothetical protein
MKDRKVFAAIPLVALLCTIFFAACADSHNDGIDLNRMPVLGQITPDLKSRATELRGRLVTDDSCYFAVNSDGSLSFHNGHSFVDGLAFEMTDAAAEAYAKDTLRELDLLPGGDYRIVVDRMESEIPAHGGSAENPVTLEISVTFIRTYKEIDVMCSDGNGIRLTICKDGMSNLQYLWRHLEIQEAAAVKNPLSAEDAHRIYLDNWDTLHGDCCEPNMEPVIKQAYFQKAAIMHPAWVISDNDEYLNAIYIDMLTGEILYG